MRKLNYHIKYFFIVLVVLLFSHNIVKAQTSQKKIIVGATSGYNTPMQVIDLQSQGSLVILDTYEDSVNLFLNGRDSSKYGTRLIRLTASLDTLWTQKLHLFYTTSAIVNSNGEYLLSGYKVVRVPLTSTTADLYYWYQVIKLTATGNVLIVNSTVDKNSPTGGQGAQSAIIETTNNNYIVALTAGNYNTLNANHLSLLYLDNTLTAQKRIAYKLNIPVPTLSKRNENEYVVASTNIDLLGNTNTNHPLLLIDTNLSIISHKSLPVNYNIKSINCNNNTVFVSGTVNTNRLINNGFDNNNYNNYFTTKLVDGKSDTNTIALLYKQNFNAKGTFSYANTYLYQHNLYTNIMPVFNELNTNIIIDDSLSTNFRTSIIKIDTNLNVLWNKRLHIFGTKIASVNSLNLPNATNFITSYTDDSKLLFKNDKVHLLQYQYSSYGSFNTITPAMRNDMGLSITTIDTTGNKATCNSTPEQMLIKYDSVKWRNLPIPDSYSAILRLTPDQQNVTRVRNRRVEDVCLPLLPPKSKFLGYNINFNPITNDTLCINTKLSLFEYSYNEPKTWKWLIPSGVSQTNLDSLYLPNVNYLQFNQVGNYTIKLITTNDAGSDTAQKVFYVVDYVPQPNLGKDTILCYGKSLSLHYNAPINATHTFYGPGGFTSSANSIIAAVTGQYIVVVKNVCGTVSDTINVEVEKKTEARFLAQVPCNNLTVQLASVSQVNDGAILTYQYAYKLTSNVTSSYISMGNSAALNYTFAAYTNYTVRLIVTSIWYNCTAVDTVLEIISMRPKPTATASYTNTCGSLSATFSNTSSIIHESIFFHQWFYNNELISMQPTFTYTFPNYGTHTIKYVAFSNTFCPSDTLTLTVLIKENPQATIAYNNNACANFAYLLTATNVMQSNVAITSHGWWVNNTPQLNNTTIYSHTATPGVYTMAYQSTSALGCVSNIATQLVQVQTKPLANLVSTATACVSTAVTLTNTSTNSLGNPLTYTWLINGAAAATSVNYIHTFTSGGSNTVTLIAQSPNGCTDSITKMVTVQTKPTASFTYTNACLNTGTLYTSTSSNINGAITTYNWQLGNGQTATTPTASTIYTMPATYNVTLTVGTSYGCKGTTTIPIIIKPVVLIPNTTDTTVAINQPLQLLVTGASTYQWQPVFGLSSAIISNPIMQVALPGVYTYAVTSIDASGCKQITNIKVTAYNNIGLYIPTIFTPNNDGNNDTWRIVCSGVKQLTYVYVYNRYGQLVYTQSGCSQPAWSGLLQGKALPVGAYVYMYKAINYLGATITGKGTVVLAR